MKKTLLLMVSLIGLPLLLPAADAPKKLLVVTTTAAFRHASIPTGEKILGQLAKESGEFTVDYLRQPEIAKPPVAPKQPTLKTNATGFTAPAPSRTVTITLVGWPQPAIASTTSRPAVRPIPPS